MPKDGTIPSGSMSVHDVPDNPDNTDDNDKGKGGGDKDTPYLGTYKTREDAEKGLGELNKKLGDQGKQLGDLKKQNQELQHTLLTLQGQKGGKSTDDGKDGEKGGKGKSTDDDLGKTFEDFGALDFVEDDDAPKKAAELLKKAVMQTAKTVKEETLREAGTQVEGLLKEKDSAAVRDQFLKENPDFTELQGQGVFQALKSKNPLHDDFSAYFAHRSDQATARIAELEAELEEAKKVANLAGGDEGTRKVFTKPGQGVRNGDRSKPKTRAERHASAMEAVRKARGG